MKVPSGQARPPITYASAGEATSANAHAAIVTAGEQAGLSTAGHDKIDEIPYDFLRKRLTIVMTEGGDAARHLVVTKGAFSNVLSICTQVERDGAVCAMRGPSWRRLKTVAGRLIGQ